MTLNDTFNKQGDAPCNFQNAMESDTDSVLKSDLQHKSHAETVQYQQRFSVEFSYDVIHTHNLFSPENKAIASLLGHGSTRGIFFVDSNVASAFPDLSQNIQTWFKAHPDVLKTVPSVHTVVGGEAVKKGFKHMDAVIQKMMDEKICRHSYVFIIGGGAVIDAVSFAASVFHRGIRQIRIPTTVLSQDDSAVGVKNSINYHGIKNLLGVFCPPHAVLIDDRFLRTLSLRDISAGVAEAFKVALIKDETLYHFLKKEHQKVKVGDPEVLRIVVEKSAKIHARHIQNSGDPFEKGSSRPLDFGHWSAHKLESLTHNDLLHGEAVSIGMSIDLICAAQLGLISMELACEVIDTFESCGLIIWDDRIKQKEPSGKYSVLKGLEEFREHLGGALTLAMPVAIGKARDIHELPEKVVVSSLKILEAHAKRQ